MEKTPKISVIIANYYGDKFLKDCLDSIKKQTYKDIEIIVVSETDGDCPQSGLSPNILVSFHFMPNRGLASAYNYGSKFSNGEYLFFINPDIILNEDCIFNLVSEIEKDTAIFSVDPAQYDKDNHIIHSRTILKKGKFFTTFIPGIENIQIETENVKEVPWTSAGAMLVRKNFFLDLKGFDKDYFMEWEDVDLCWRALFMGLKCIFVPQAKVKHFVGGCSEGKKFRRAIEWNKGLIRFVIKVMPVKIILSTLFIHILRIVANIVKINFKRSVAIFISFLITFYKLFFILKERKEILSNSKTSSLNLIKYFII